MEDVLQQVFFYIFIYLFIGMKAWRVIYLIDLLNVEDI